MLAALVPVLLTTGCYSWEFSASGDGRGGGGTGSGGSSTTTGSNGGGGAGGGSTPAACELTWDHDIERTDAHLFGDEKTDGDTRQEVSSVAIDATSTSFAGPYESTLNLGGGQLPAATDASPGVARGVFVASFTGKSLADTALRYAVSGQATKSIAVSRIAALPGDKLAVSGTYSGSGALGAYSLPDTTNDTFGYVTALDTQGAKVWGRTLDASTVEIRDLVSTSAGVLVGGRFLGADLKVGSTTYYTDYFGSAGFAARFDTTTGVDTWVNLLICSVGDAEIRAVATASNGDIYVLANNSAGFSSGSCTFASHPMGIAEGDHVLLFRLTADGTFVSVHTLDSDGPINGIDLVVVDDDPIVLATLRGTLKVDGLDKGITTDGTDDMLVAAFDNTGVSAVFKTYGDTSVIVPRAMVGLGTDVMILGELAPPAVALGCPNPFLAEGLRPFLLQLNPQNGSTRHAALFDTSSTGTYTLSALDADPGSTGAPYSIAVGGSMSGDATLTFDGGVLTMNKSKADAAIALLSLP